LATLYYFYPQYQEVTWKLIAQQHIKRLRAYSSLVEHDINILRGLHWTGGKAILIHPVFYTILGARWPPRAGWEVVLSRLKATSTVLGGFELADSDRISESAVRVTNEFDLVIVPSRFAFKAFKRSGVYATVEVLPHGVPEPFLEDNCEVRSAYLKRLEEFKDDRDALFILFHIAHSGYRKGADLLAEAIKPILESYDNVYLVLKRLSGLDPYLGMLRTLKTLEVDVMLTWDEMRELYDLVDVCVVPSRGGGFELPALEAISRGVPTLVTAKGCFEDYIKYAIPVKVARKVKVFEDNPIHVGYGFEVSVNDLRKKLETVIRKLDSFKRRFRRYSLEVRESYSWDRVVERLRDILDRHGFYGG